MYINFFLVAGLIGLAQAQSYTPPGAQTFGSLYTPDVNNPVTRGESFKVTWDPTGHTTDGSTVSLVLCRGGSGNCVNAPTAIVSGVPANQASYNWAVPCSLATGVKSTATGYGMLIIVDGTGQFQYSTQFSVLEGAKCGSGSTNSSSSTTSYSSTSTSASASTSKMYTSSTTSYMTSSMKPNNYTSMTTLKPSSHTTLTATTTVAPASTTPSASPSPSQFKGAANTIGGSAAALIMAAGAAFFAL